MTGYFAKMTLSLVLDALRALAETVLSSIGWGGVIGLLAGCLLLLTLSAKAVKFMTSKTGMAVLTALTIAGVYFAGLFGGTPEVPKGPMVLADNRPPTIPKPVPLKTAPEPMPEEEVEETEEEDESPRPSQWQPWEPLPFVAAAPMPLPLPTPPLVTPHVNPPVYLRHPAPVMPHRPTASRHATATHAATLTGTTVRQGLPAAASQQTGVTHTNFGAAATPSAVATRPTRRTEAPATHTASSSASPMANGPWSQAPQQGSDNGVHPGSGLTAAQQARYDRALFNRQMIHQQNIMAGEMMKQMMGQYMTGGYVDHPAMHAGNMVHSGIHPGFSGQFPAMQGGMGHMPAGGMGHMGGHN